MDVITNPVGEWWMCVNRGNKSRCIVDGDKPVSYGDDGWTSQRSSFAWAIEGQKGFEAFKDINLPEWTFEKGPVKIEIDKQHNVTWWKE